MSALLLEVRELAVAYKGVAAVEGVSMSVGAGRIVSVVGANGAGKTSTLNAIMGIVPSSGGIDFRGKALKRMPVEARVWAGLCLVPEKRELFSTMPVENNLLLGAFHQSKSGARAGRLDQIYELFPPLRERRRQIAGTLSGGERQMLAMGRALMGNPRLLMLDEPSLGLAPLIVRSIFKIIKNLRSSGVTVLLVEQNAREALDIADYGYVMERGKIVLEGPAAELKQDARVIESYLGVASVRSGMAVRPSDTVAGQSG